MGALESMFINPYDIPSFLLKEKLLEVVHKYKIPIQAPPHVVRRIDTDGTETVDLSDENEFEISIYLHSLRAPLHREYSMCLWISRLMAPVPEISKPEKEVKKVEERKVINCAGQAFGSLSAWINKYRKDYDNKIVIYTRRGPQRYFTRLLLDETSDDPYYLVWARKVVYSPDESAEHVPVLLRQYTGFAGRFDVYICLPHRCVVLTQRKLALHGRIPGQPGSGGVDPHANGAGNCQAAS